MNAAMWDNPRLNWAEFDLVVVRSYWNYASRRNEFQVPEESEWMIKPAISIASLDIRRYQIPNGCSISDTCLKPQIG